MGLGQSLDERVRDAKPVLVETAFAVMEQATEFQPVHEPEPVPKSIPKSTRFDLPESVEVMGQLEPVAVPQRKPVEIAEQKSVPIRQPVEVAVPEPVAIGVGDGSQCQA